MSNIDVRRKTRALEANRDSLLLKAKKLQSDLAKTRAELKVHKSQTKAKKA